MPLATLVTGFFSYFANVFSIMFLPQGYPTSVSKDYYYYQLWDTLQGFVGYVKGQLLTLCFLQALGMGKGTDSKAALFNAMTLWILRDTTGVIFGLCSGIPYLTDLFSKKSSISFWKMTSEFIRAGTGIIEIYAVQSDYTVILSCLAVGLNTIAGTMDQQVRATLMTHFAIQNNIADCAAKESNQDRGIKVFGIPLAFFWLLQVQQSTSYMFYTYAVLIIFKIVFTHLSCVALNLHASVDEKVPLADNNVNSSDKKDR